MQNDIELLGLAAKAAGIELQWSRVIGSSPRKSSCWSVWNPLIDDGDAFRLAVKLQLTVWNEHLKSGATYCTRGDEVFMLVNSGEVCHGPVDECVVPDDYANTRRAIVLAAAEIGRSME